MLGALITCSTCNGQPPLRDSCVSDGLMNLAGVAMRRGDAWAEGVIRRMPARQARPGCQLLVAGGRRLQVVEVGAVDRVTSCLSGAGQLKWLKRQPAELADLVEL